ncbi:MAG TPA: hypothetical protein VHT91_30920 [Kofleriaceae bacterium]|nr:hypothetical protein [Kofleriaceae bacterium]
MELAPKGVSSPGDASEAEADRVAERVAAGRSAGPIAAAPSGALALHPVGGKDTAIIDAFPWIATRLGTVDIGHVMAGIDAALNGGPSAYPEDRLKRRGEDNGKSKFKWETLKEADSGNPRAFATWAGDLGQAYAVFISDVVVVVCQVHARQELCGRPRRIRRAGSRVQRPGRAARGSQRQQEHLEGPGQRPAAQDRGHTRRHLHADLIGGDCHATASLDLRDDLRAARVRGRVAALRRHRRAQPVRAIDRALG